MWLEVSEHLAICILVEYIVNHIYIVEAINLKCENDGYADPKNHSRCKCPAEWSGDTCDTITKGSAGILLTLDSVI